MLLVLSGESEAQQPGGRPCPGCQGGGCSTCAGRNQGGRGRHAAAVPEHSLSCITNALCAFVCQWCLACPTASGTVAMRPLTENGVCDTQPVPGSPGSPGHRERRSPTANKARSPRRWTNHTCTVVPDTAHQYCSSTAVVLRYGSPLHHTPMRQLIAPSYHDSSLHLHTPVLQPDVEIPPSPWTNTESLVVDEEQTISRISFGVIGITTGVSLLVYGFGAYFQV